MGYFQESNDTIGIGVTPNNGNTRGILMGAYLLKPEASWTTEANVRKLADLQTLLIAKTCYPLIGVKEVETKIGEDKIYASPTDVIIDLARGLVSHDFKCFVDEDQALTMYDWEGKNWEVVFYDNNNNLYFKENSDGTMGGFSVGRLKVGTLTFATKDSPAWVMLSLQEKDANERRTYGRTCVPEYVCSEQAGVVRCVLTTTAISSNDFNVTVSYVSRVKVGDTDAFESVPITNLVTANFEVIDTSGTPAVEVITVTESAIKGTYLVEGTALTAGTIELKPTATELYDSLVTTITT